MKLSQQFPANAGWITAKLSLKRGATFTDQEAREFITFGKPHRMQFGHIDTDSRPVKVIARDLKKAALDPTSQPTESPLDPHTPTPFIARCGNVVVQVNEVISEFLPMVMIDVEILSGFHFNDRGDYGPGDTVRIGPITDHWRILTFPDLTATA